jgi:hypothetical protein
VSDTWNEAMHCLRTSPGVSSDELEEIKAGILRLAGLAADLVPMDLTWGQVEPSGWTWPTWLAGAWYQRGSDTQAEGWHRHGPHGREPVPAEVIVEAGVPAVLRLPGGMNMLVLQAQPVRNLIPRPGGSGASLAP